VAGRRPSTVRRNEANAVNRVPNQAGGIR
jgi:hypothetical protein